MVARSKHRPILNCLLRKLATCSRGGEGGLQPNNMVKPTLPTVNSLLTSPSTRMVSTSQLTTVSLRGRPTSRTTWRQAIHKLLCHVRQARKVKRSMAAKDALKREHWCPACGHTPGVVLDTWSTLSIRWSAAVRMRRATCSGRSWRAAKRRTGRSGIAGRSRVSSNMTCRSCTLTQQGTLLQHE